MAAKKNTGTVVILIVLAVVLAAGAYKRGYFDRVLPDIDWPDLSTSLGTGSGNSAGNGGYVRPAAGQVTSGFGPRWGAMHYGVDIANTTGTPIYAVTRGRVIEAGPASGFGLWVRVEHPGGDVSVYGHMDTITTATGQRVDTGEQIATIGSRGQSTGPHLHFEVWPHGDRTARGDPAAWLAHHGVQL